MKYIYYIVFLTMALASCDTQNDKTGTKPKIGVENILYDNVSLYLPKKYERYNIKELNILLKSTQTNAFIQGYFNAEAIEYYSNTDQNLYFFIDTTAYEDVLIFEKLPRLFPVNKENAKLIGSGLKTGLYKNLNIQDLEIGHEEIHFGENENFSYLHYKFNCHSNQLDAYSNQIAFSSKTGSYLLGNISLKNTDLLYLRDQITFQ